MKVPIAKVNLTKNEINSVLEPLKNGWLVQGPIVREFEDKWSKFVGVNHSVAVTSCTSAMQISLSALGFSPGDEAIVPAFTWISTANVVEQLGGKVVFCDINLDTFNIDVDLIEEKVSSKTKVILPVHLFGMPADMKKIKGIAQKYNLKVIEDAACGFGSKINNQHVGSFGDVGCFSFHPRKAITTGEGGMVTTNNEKLAEKIRVLRDHGAVVSDLQRHLGPKPYLLADHVEAGYNQRMTDIQAALGLAQMHRANDILIERAKIAERYRFGLKDCKNVILPSQIDNYTNGYQSFPCIFNSLQLDYENVNEIEISRNTFMEDLFKNGISTRPATHSVVSLSYYKNKYKIKEKSFPNATLASKASFSLPLYNGMSKKEIDYVINAVIKYFKL
jgi:perosamine synthetase